MWVPAAASVPTKATIQFKAKGVPKYLPKISLDGGGGLFAFGFYFLQGRDITWKTRNRIKCRGRRGGGNRSQAFRVSCSLPNLVHATVLINNSVTPSRVQTEEHKENVFWARRYLGKWSDGFGVSRPHYEALALTQKFSSAKNYLNHYLRRSLWSWAQIIFKMKKKNQIHCCRLITINTRTEPQPPVITCLCKAASSLISSTWHMQALPSSPWHKGWENPAPRPAPRGRDKYQSPIWKPQPAEREWCSVHSSSAQPPVQAACCPLATAACSAHSPSTLFWSKEDHSCVLLCLGAPGAAALLDLYHVWFGFTADHWARFPFSLQLGTCQTRAAHLDVLPTSMCVPPPSSKNTLLLQAGKTGPPKTTWK